MKLFRKKDTEALTPIAIISASLMDLTDEVKGTRTEALRRYLVRRFGGDAIEQCTGCYEGETEDSFIVRLNPDQLDHDIETMDGLSRFFHQDSWLYRSGKTGRAYLMFTDKRPVRHIGQFKQISPASAQHMSGYTCINSTGVYFTTVKDDRSVGWGIAQDPMPHTLAAVG